MSIYEKVVKKIPSILVSEGIPSTLCAKAPVSPATRALSHCQSISSKNIPVNFISAPQSSLLNTIDSNLKYCYTS